MIDKKFSRLAFLVALSLSVVPSWALPRPDHIVVIVEENHSSGQVIGSSDAPYINKMLVPASALMTQSFALTHPSEPNYLALFSGSTQGLVSDACPVDLGKSPNLAHSLLAGGFTFTGYSESLPSVGSENCKYHGYARKHCPWVDWQEDGGFPTPLNQPFTAFPSGPDYGSLSTVCWVIPNLVHDMHDGSVKEGDDWLKKNMGGYIAWCQAHNSLLILTWDEDDNHNENQIATLFFGPMVRPGRYGEVINHYNVLRTILDMFYLAPINNAAKVAPIIDIFSGPVPTPVP